MPTMNAILLLRTRRWIYPHGREQPTIKFVLVSFGKKKKRFPERSEYARREFKRGIANHINFSFNI